MEVTQPNYKICFRPDVLQRLKESNSHHLHGSRHNTAYTRFNLKTGTRMLQAENPATLSTYFLLPAQVHGAA